MDERVFNHDGCVVDVGCAGWDWSGIFLNKKRVIGVDPNEDSVPAGAELFRGVLGPFNGKAEFRVDGIRSTTMGLNLEETVDMIGWKSFCRKFEIDRVSVLKLNIEGSEYSLLSSMDSDDFAMIDQIAVSFHDWMNESWKHLTDSCLSLLKSMGFRVEKICEKFGWYLAVREAPKTARTTIVTGLWDLERGSIEGWGKRDFAHYLECFKEMLETDFPMCIWIPGQLEEDVRRAREGKATKIFIKNNEDFETWNPFFNKIQSIRSDEKWVGRAGWLRESPNAALKYYNAMMFTKMFMLNDSAIMNPFGSEYFFWMDGGLTNTVDKGYFQHDRVLENLANYMESERAEYLHLTFPYESNDEIHGFDRNAMARYCGTDFVKYVARGGFFGGSKKSTHEMNALYYDVMKSSLEDGEMGADECLFTILCHRHPEKIKRYQVEGNGLVWPFFEELKNHKEKQPIRDGVGMYVITFNSPKQFRTLLESMTSYDADFLMKTRKFLLDNSTDLSTTPEYVKLCEEYGFEHIKKDNLGITGGRQFIAEHFDSQKELGRYFFFEDDMFFVKNEGVCRSGFNRKVPGLFKKSMEILEREGFDFLKLNFSEFYGTNEKQWAWYNVPQSFRQEQWPEYCKLPEHGFDPDSPCQKFGNIKSHEGVPYASGEIYLCNWPILMSKKGNFRCYLETKYAHPFEQTIMSHCYQETVKGKIKPGVLLLSPTEHERFDFYEASLRKEC